MSNLFHSISDSPTCSTNLCHQRSLGLGVGLHLTSDLLSMTVQLWVHSLHCLGRICWSSRCSRCVFCNTIWWYLCVSLSDSMWMMMMDRVCWFLMDMHGHYVRACGGKWVMEIVSASNWLHERIRRCQHHGTARFFTGCRRACSVQKLRETILDGVLLLWKTPGSCYGLHARPTG